MSISSLQYANFYTIDTKIGFFELLSKFKWKVVYQHRIHYVILIINIVRLIGPHFDKQ